MVEVIQKIAGDFRDRNIVDVEFVPFNEKEQQIERTFKKGEFNLKMFLRHRGKIIQIAIQNRNENQFRKFDGNLAVNALNSYLNLLFVYYYPDIYDAYY